VQLAVTGSAARRSWSQSSQGCRADAFSPRVPQTGQMAAEDHGVLVAPGGALVPQQSPRAQSSRLHLEGGTTTSAALAAVTGAVASDQVRGDEAQMAQVRDSLLQHIQSVQKEITRLQAERQRTAPATATGVGPGANAALVTQVATVGQHVPAMLSGSSTLLVPAGPCSPRGVSRLEPPPKERGGGARPVVWSQRDFQATKGAGVTLVTTGQVQKAVAAQTLPSGPASQATIQPLATAHVQAVPVPQLFLQQQEVAVTGVTQQKVAEAAARRIQQFWRQRGGSPERSRSGVALRQGGGGPAAATAAGASPRRSGPPVPPVSGMPPGHLAATAAPNASPRKRQQVRAVHHAACRIQRAWKVSRWRRKFIDFSEREIGWVGSLDWLQHHNLLYGTELADPEDVRWWMQQRTTAPFDREVDPWGSSKLRDHLNKMWYGRTTEELQGAMQELQLQRMESAQAQERRLEGGGTFAGYSANGQEVFVLYEGQGGQPWVTTTTSQTYVSNQAALAQKHVATAGAGTAVPQLRASLTGERPGSTAGIRSLNMAAAATASANKATSLSPRREASWVKRDSLGRSRGLVQGAAPTQTQSFTSPPQTHRAARTTAPLGATITTATAVPQSVVLGTTTAAALQRPQSPLQTQRRRPTQGQGAAVAPTMAGRFSLPGPPSSARPQTTTSTTASANATVARHHTTAGAPTATGSQPPSGSPQLSPVSRIPLGAAAPATASVAPRRC
jgi:hypothetical protein